MSYALGIDIGTSNTAAALMKTTAAGDATAESLSLGRSSAAIPSVVYLDDDGSVLVGEAAVRRGLEHPDRVIREFKRRIGDEVPFAVGDLDVAAEDVYAIVAEWVVERAAALMGSRPEAITLTHPSSWGEFRIGLVKDALADRGLDDVEMLTEPEAAAVHYSTQERVDPGTTIAVYDLGGGTFDAAVLRRDDRGAFELVGKSEGIDRLGGADFDQSVLAHVDEHVDGALSKVDADDPAALLALARVRRECIEAKEALSFDTEASIPVLLTDKHSSVRLVRAEFEAMIEGQIRETAEVLERTITSSGVEVDDVAAILLVGGSSRIPIIAQTLSATFERPIAIDADPKASSSLGAAHAAAFGAAGLAIPDDVPAELPDIDEVLYGSRAESAQKKARTTAPAEAPVAEAPKPWYQRRDVRITGVAAAAALAIVLVTPATPMGAGLGNFLAEGARAVYTATVPEELIPDGLKLPGTASGVGAGTSASATEAPGRDTSEGGGITASGVATGTQPGTTPAPTRVAAVPNPAAPAPADPGGPAAPDPDPDPDPAPVVPADPPPTQAPDPAPPEPIVTPSPDPDPPPPVETETPVPDPDPPAPDPEVPADPPPAADPAPSTDPAPVADPPAPDPEPAAVAEPAPDPAPVDPPVADPEPSPAAPAPDDAGQVA